ncbi:unnamed protein product [Rangifer tarandus platyrhynchus]|uniref:Uncharacterized protein n=1 Tax=Rangifer tarandus platyrhynchus TaxID=3082113 RepID=A0AC59ZBG2_RANTA
MASRTVNLLPNHEARLRGNGVGTTPGSRRVMGEHLEAGKESKASSMSVGLQGDSSLQVEISDAVSERSGTRGVVPVAAEGGFRSPSSLAHLHEEFIWLHDAYEGGVCRPPHPPSPSTVRLFEASKEKLQKPDEEDRSITRQEFAKMKQELEADPAPYSGAARVEGAG